MVKMLFILRVSTLNEIYEIRSTFLVLDHTKSHGGNTMFVKVGQKIVDLLKNVNILE